MSDLEKYITKKKAVDKKFADNFEEGYKDFEIFVVLKQLRKESGLTQEDLAKKPHTKKTAISKLENQWQDMKVSTLFKIAKAFHKHSYNPCLSTTYREKIDFEFNYIFVHMLATLKRLSRSLVSFSFRIEKRLF